MSARGDLAGGLAPDALVRGDDAGLLLATLELASWASGCQETLDGYLALAPVWEGRAREQWDRRTTIEARRWRVAESALRNAADALETYRSALQGARESAHEARRLWDSGVAAHQAEAATVRRQRAEARAAGERVFIEPYMTAGESEKDRAVLLLEQARSAVQDAGHRAAETLSRQAEAAPHPTSLWESAKSAVSDPFGFAAASWATVRARDWEQAGVDFAGYMQRDPRVMREVGSGMVIGAGDALTSMAPNGGDALSSAWESETNQWSWEHGMATGGAAMAGGVLVGGELINNLGGPEARSASATERAAGRLLKRLERYEKRYGISHPVQTWDKAKPLHRGIIVEAHHGGNLPGGFKTIDVWDDVSGTATSVKSMDLRAPTYGNDSAVRSTLTGYVDKMADYEGGRRGGVVVDEFLIQRRELLVVVPPDTVIGRHHDIVASVQEYARSRGVSMIVKEWP